jgi:nucleotide-binding universal stress UspA family protein
MYRRILVGVDGSAASLRGLTEAIGLAKTTGATVSIVHVVNELIADAAFAPSVYYDALIAALREAGSRVLEHAEVLLRQAQVPFESRLVEAIGGRVADALVREAAASSADLIVMGTHGRHGIARLVMGSDAELVLRSAPVPVLMIPFRGNAAALRGSPHTSAANRDGHCNS